MEQAVVEANTSWIKWTEVVRSRQKWKKKKTTFFVNGSTWPRSAVPFQGPVRQGLIIEYSIFTGLIKSQIRQISPKFNEIKFYSTIKEGIRRYVVNFGD